MHENPRTGLLRPPEIHTYGQRNGYNLQALEKGMTLVVLEQFGRTAPGAQAIFNRIINHRHQLLVRQGMPFSHAKRVASSEVWGPISSTLLRAAWQAQPPRQSVLQESARRVLRSPFRGLWDHGTQNCTSNYTPAR